MNILVCIKQVPDTEATILIKEGKTINETTIKWILNPYDEYALEEALKLKEKTPGSTVTAISLGAERVEQVLRTALAMGADKAVHILSSEDLDSPATAKALAEAARRQGEFGIIFSGKQAIDDDAYQTHIWLAEFLGIPAATNVTAFTLTADGVEVEREIDEGAKELISMNRPCLVAAAKGLNTPRYASVMGIMKAKKIEITRINASDLGVSSAANHRQLVKLSVPKEKPPGKVIPGDIQSAVPELVRLLKEEAKVI